MNRAFVDKSLLQLVQLVGAAQTFDSQQIGAGSLYSWNHAGIDELAVHNDGTSAAFAFAAAFFAASQFHVVANHIQKPG